MQRFKRHIQFLLGLSVLALIIPPVKAETDPCTRVYSVAETIMLARQMGTIIPEVIKNTNALIAALPEKQAAVLEPALRRVIIDAYRQERRLFSGSSAVEDFGNAYTLRCLEGQEENFSKIVWNESTKKAFDMWMDNMVNKAESVKVEDKKQALNEVAKQDESETRSLEKLNKKEESDLALLNALAIEKAAANVLNAMTTKITRAWRRPPVYKGGGEVLLRMSLGSNGELMDVTVVGGSGDIPLNQSAVDAVKRAAPFGEVKQFDAATFEEKFRSMTVKFRPEN